MTKRESEYFENLVFHDQAETEKEKKFYLERLASRSPSNRYKVLEAFQMEYFKKWFYAAVRELLTLEDFQGDYKKLAEMLEPSITPGEAMDAIHLLLKLKLIRKNAQGRMEKVDKVVSSGLSSDPALIRPAIRGNLELAMRSLEEHPAAIRPFSYLTLSLDEDSYTQIRETLNVFRKDILDIAARSQSTDRLYQLNFQLFPLSKIKKPVKK